MKRTNDELPARGRHCVNVNSCSSEISNIKSLASNNSLRLNPTKPTEIILSTLEARLKLQHLHQVESIKMLGVTFARKFSVLQHANDILSHCSQSLFALQTLRQHGLPTDALQVVFQAIVINKLTYASPAWWGFASTDDQNRIEAFLRRSTKLGYQANSKSTFASLCDEADERLFHHVTYN